jgi:hypothetical protein
MKYKIFQANNIVWLICIGLKFLFSKTSMIYEIADSMSSINFFVLLYFAGFVIGDYLKKNYSEDETSEN